MNKKTILVADDDPDIRNILHDRLEDLGYQVILVEDGGQAIARVNSEEPDLMLLDMQMPVMSGMDVLKSLKDKFTFPIIIITAFGSIDKSVEAMRHGAYDFIIKPFSPDHLDVVIRKALEYRNLKQDKLYLEQEINAPYRKIIGQSPAIVEAIDVARRAARTASSILLLGESGTGKEIFARSIHRWSPRAERPFVVINCVALSKELVESELFGHEKGAFTGAHQIKKGKLEIANGGTVFLDELGDVHPDIQAKLLRVIQERQFERVGGSKTINVDIRIIAATNRDLHQAMKEGHFREDLFFRLNVISINLPPLRSRKEDILALSQFLLKRACTHVNRPLMTITAEALKLLKDYYWPGNVRELSNMIERAAVLVERDEIKPQDFPIDINIACEDQSDVDSTQHMDKPYHDAVKNFQVELITHALQQSSGNQTKAAACLGLQRTYLSRLIKNLGISEQ